MMMDDESSNIVNFQITNNLANLQVSGTPSKNKRFRNNSVESNDDSQPILSRPQAIAQTITQAAKNNTNKLSQKFHYPPFIVTLISQSEGTTDRKIIDELITTWSITHNKLINVTGRYGHNKSLLIFANDSATFEELMVSQRWPNRLSQSDIEIKQPRQYPSMYSLVIQRFHRKWKADEVLEELKQNYPTLSKLTRMMAKNEIPLNLVRADFTSLKQVDELLAIGTIDIGNMKHTIKRYHSPIRVSKCMKCYSHHHKTNECTNQQVCIRCGQQHRLRVDCQNEIKCVNCGGEHYAGHSSCPQVREIRREVGEKYKKMRTEQIVRQEQLEYDEDRQNFPKLGPSTYPRPYIPIFGKYPQQGSQLTQQERQTSFAKTSYEASSIENILQSFTDKMDGRLQQLQSTITEQLCDIEVKIDKQQAITNALESILYDLVLPSVKLIQLGLSSLEEWVHFGTKETLLDNWLEEYRPPEVRNGDLLNMVSEFSPSIISLNELGTSIP
ncbi:unnamed protein product, partial [Didymodactylos carnosus]